MTFSCLLRKVYSEFNEPLRGGLSLRFDLVNEPLTIACDPVVINRTLVNLITNVLRGAATFLIRATEEYPNFCLSKL